MIIHIAILTEVIIANGVMIYGIDSNGNVSPPELQAAAQPYINAFDDSEAFAATWVAQKEKIAATNQIDYGDQQRGLALERVIRAVAMAALDAFNRDRQCFTDMNTAVQAATNLADLKTRFATISYPPQVTGAQLVTAIKAKIAASAE